jgi:23S rRNA (adenine2503-C2)-methyltransferase
MRPEKLVPPASALERLPEEWAELLASWGEPSYRALQVFRWIHQRGVLDAARMSDLPKALRERIAAELRPPLAVSAVHASIDGTHKLVLDLHDGKRIESVLIPRGSVAAADVYAPLAPDEGDADAGSEASASAPPVTQCISSQVGCAMACVFCASGIAGLKRNLTAAEIVGQVLAGRQRLSGSGSAVGEAQAVMPGRLAGIVLMGMGEPLHNYDHTVAALVLMADIHGMAISPKRITLSTSGLVPALKKLVQEPVVPNLAVSLNASTDAQRSQLIPINRRWPMQELLDTCRDLALPPGRRITFEYVLIAGVNDTLDDARRLTKLLSNQRAKVNLIPLNWDPVLHGMGTPQGDRILAFQRVLTDHHFTARIRRPRGLDISAACGQLAARHQEH